MVTSLSMLNTMTTVILCAPSTHHHFTFSFVSLLQIEQKKNKKKVHGVSPRQDALLSAMRQHAPDRCGVRRYDPPFRLPELSLCTCHPKNGISLLPFGPSNTMNRTDSSTTKMLDRSCIRSPSNENRSMTSSVEQMRGKTSTQLKVFLFSWS